MCNPAVAGTVLDMTNLVTVNIPSVTNLPKDAVSNQFAISGLSSSNLADFAAIAAAVADFYNGAGATWGEKICQYMSDSLSRVTNACTVKMYDLDGHLDGSNHGSPVAAGTFTLGAALAGTPLPSEVACVLRLEATGRATALSEVPDSGDPGSSPDRPKQRRTGRVFIGPLQVSAITEASNIARVSPNLIGNITDAALRLAAAIGALTGSSELGVWSRADQIVRDLESVAVDNAFDTQRRRGESASGLTRVTVP